MSTSGRERVEHIKRAIQDARAALSGKSFDEAYDDRTAWLAFERCIEIISEASRKLPEDWKSKHGSNIPWQDIASIGNTMRHAYHHVMAPRIWAVYTADLDPLERAIDSMLSANPRLPAQS